MINPVKKIVKKEEHDYIVFKVTPHASNLNSTSRKFQSSIYELFSFRYQKYPWQRKPIIEAFKKNNLYVHIKESPKFWWVVKMYGLATDEKTDSDEQLRSQRIEFYMAVPSDFKEAFKTKFNNHDQWKKASLEEIKEDLQFPDVSYTDLYNVKYTRNNMFSLDYDYAKQVSPIRDILSVSKELDCGEEVNFYIKTEAMSRKRWKKLVDYSWSVWEKGKVPSKSGLDINMFTNDVTSFAMMIAYEVKCLIDDILYGIGKTFFNDKSDKPQNKRVIYLNGERESLLVDGDLSRPTKTKRNKPVFITDMFYTVTSKDEVKRDMLSRSMTNSFSDMNKDNSLVPMKITINAKKELNNLKEWKISTINSNLMSVDEVGKLEQLPTAELQKEFKDSLLSNDRVEISMNKELLDERGILAGTATNKGKVYNLHIQTKNEDMTNTARAFIGSPRMGKDQAAINLVVEAKRKHNKGSIILEVINEQNGHRGMGNAIRDHLPEEDVIDFNLMDYDNPIYMGLEPIVQLISDSRIASDRVAEQLCDFLLSDGDEDKLRTVEHLREAAKLTNADILSIKHIFISKALRDKVVNEKKGMFDMDIWEQYNKLSEAQQQGIYTPVMRRIGQIMSSEFLKPIFCQRPNPNLDLFKMIDEGKVIIFRMKSGIMSQRAIETLSYWIVLVCFLIKLAQDGKSKNNNGTFLILNEPHQYLTDGLVHFIERIFAEGPKYRLAPVLIFHNFKQFKKFPGFVDIMKSASLNWHIFRNTNGDVYKELFQDYLSKTFETPTQAFEATKMYQYIGIWLNSQGGYYDPFVADALPMVKDRYKTLDNSELTLKHSKIYGRPINEVLEDIQNRNREAMKQLATGKK